MSADNWSICPQCRTNREKEDAKSPYGKVTEEEFLAYLSQKPKVEELERSLREDYEYHIDSDGVFHAHYRAHCSDCGFRFSFDHSESVFKGADDESSNL